jgi:hypothetical protein
MVTPRRGYLHHGIYVGGGNVVHYAGLSYGLRKGPVEEIPLNRFRGFRPVWVKPDPTARFQGSRVVERARSRLGENRYHLLTNNCEHFCEWCLYGEQRSYQVEELLAWYRRAIGAAIDAGRQLASLVPITRSVQRPERQYMRLVGQRLHSPSSPQGSN